jgi:hypothetical protein
MDKKTIKFMVYIASSIILLCGLFVIGDYFSLFGTKTNLKLVFAEVRFRTLDADTRGLVLDVGVRCFQKHNKNACTRRNSHRAGIVAAHVPVRRVIVSSFLFKKSEQIIKAADPKMHFMLLHQNYHNQTKTILLDDIYANKVNEYTIEMPPRKWEEQEEQTDE